MGQYLRRQVPAILRLYLLYQPLKTFAFVSLALIIPGIVVGLRFVYFYLFVTGSGKIQSLILTAILLIVGFQVLILSLVADLLAANRRLLEDTLYRVRKIELLEQGIEETNPMFCKGGPDEDRLR